MHFGNPHMLYLIGWLIPAIIIFTVFAERSRRKAMEHFAQKELLDRMTLFYSRRARLACVALTTAAAVLMIIAMARPQWGYYWKDNKVKGIDIVIGIDTSRSMLADDVRPSRLAFAKAEIWEFVKKLQGDRVGLIAFSGSAFLQCPLTVDYRGYLLALNSVTPATISRGGTTLSSAIKEAVRCYQGAEAKHKIFIIVSDGEQHEGDIEKAIELAKAEGITIYCIGVGTPEGTTLYETRENGERAAVTDVYGKPVITRLDEEPLMKIASKTGGGYLRATETRFGLDTLYEEKLSKLEKRESDSDKVKVYQEKFQYPVALAALLLLAAMIIRGRRDEQ